MTQRQQRNGWNMFGIGSMELLVILLVGVLVLGPEHLPRIMRTMNKLMSDFRRVSTDFQRTLNMEAHTEEWERQQAAASSKKSTTKKKAATDKPAKKKQPPAESEPVSTAMAEDAPEKAPEKPKSAPPPDAAEYGAPDVVANVMEASGPEAGVAEGENTTTRPEAPENAAQNRSGDASVPDASHTAEANSIQKPASVSGEGQT